MHLIGPKLRGRGMERHKPGEFPLYQLYFKSWSFSVAARAVLMKMQRDRKVFGTVCPNHMGQQGSRAAGNKKVWHISLYGNAHSTALYGDANRLSTCRVSWCQEAAVQSVCTLSSPASSNKVCASLTNVMHAFTHNNIKTACVEMN